MGNDDQPTSNPSSILGDEKNTWDVIPVSSDLVRRSGHGTGPGIHGNQTVRRFLSVEIVAGVFGIAFLAYSLQPILLLHETTIVHDHLYWGYPIFQFFAENIMNGHVPLWNPFTHGGEPFYPAILQIRLLEPITLFMIYLWKWLHIDDLVSLYNWVHVVQVVVMVFGVYVLFRPLAQNVFIRISLIPILLYSSFMFSPFRQPAPLHQFLWVPYIAYFLLRITYYKDYSWINWFILAGLIGVNWQSYFFCGPWTFSLFFFLGLLLFRRELLLGLLRSKRVVAKFSVAVTIVLAMMLPNMIVMLEKDKYVFPARMTEPGFESQVPLGKPQQYEGSSLPKDPGIVMPYSLITHTGSFSSIWDFIQIIYPDRNGYISGPSNKEAWGTPSEAYMYVGLLPWAIALLGFVVGRHELKPLWLLLATAFGLLMLGPAGGLHKILYYVYPPMWFTRHTHGFVLFFLFAFLYFYVLGFNHIVGSWNGPLFASDAGRKRGILTALVNKSVRTKHLPGIMASILFYGYVVYAFHWMTQLRYPGTNYLFLLVLSVFAIGWLLRNDLGKRGIYASLIFGHITFVLIFCRNDESAFLARCFLLLGVPSGVFFLVKAGQSLKQKGYMVILLLAVFSASLARDLSDHIALTSFLYESQRHPKDAFDIVTSARKPKLVESRRGAPLSVLGTTDQSVRYLSLLYRQPYVFSPLAAIDLSPTTPYPHTMDDIAQALKIRRWNSFFLLKHYFELINSPIPPLALEEVFCVGKSMFQFKQGALSITDDQLSPLLDGLGSKKVIQLLAKCVLINGEDVDDRLSKFGMSDAECKALTQAASDTSGGPERKNDFSYSVKQYEYDSFSTDVVTAQDGILYWADGFDEGWHAYIDGQETPIYRANVNFKAVILPKGSSHIQFVYEHILFNIGVATYLGSFCLALTLALIIRFFSSKWLHKKPAVQNQA
jgi:hypothetical protein